MESGFKYPIGQQFMRRDSRSNHLTNYVEEVGDRITVVNNKGEVIKQYYTVFYFRLGSLTTYDITENEITHALSSRTTNTTRDRLN